MATSLEGRSINGRDRKGTWDDQARRQQPTTKVLNGFPLHQPLCSFGATPTLFSTEKSSKKLSKLQSETFLVTLAHSFKSLSCLVNNKVASPGIDHMCGKLALLNREFHIF